MRRLAVIVLVLLVVLGIVGVVADRLIVARVEDRLLTALEENAEVAPGADVTIDGFPFLTQVLADRLAEVRGTAPGLVLDGFELSDVRFTARGVTPEEPYTAETVEINAEVPVATLAAAITDAAPLPDDVVEVEVADGLLQLGVEVLGVELAAGIDPVVVDGEVALNLGEVLLGDASAPQELVDILDDLLADVRLDIPGLPAGLEPTRLAVGEDGLQVRLEGTDVDLQEWAG